MDKLLHTIKKIIPITIFKALQPVYHFIMAWIAAFAYGFPSEKLIVIGVTGTTGKTTSVYLIAKMLEGAGLKVGYTSTAMFNDGKREWLNDKKMTMLGRFFTQRMLRDMVKNKCKYAIIETTSEGVVQFRHRFINYDILVFTGLYPEHIDSHGSFEKYKEAKGKLFKHLKKCRKKFSNENNEIKAAETGLKKLDLKQVKKTIIANGDDEHVDYFLDFWADRKITFTNNASSASDSNREVVQFDNVQVSGSGTSFESSGEKINLQLLGDFNAVNAMTAFGVGLSQDMEVAQIKKGLESIEGVAGRLERIDEGQNYVLIVDYAFEPNAVKKLYETVGLIPHNNIIHVLGSTGGGRDVWRRPVLGEIAGEKADIVIITNEDPYDEDPEIIIDQVSQGAEKKGKIINKDLFKILDRREAIKKAISSAQKDDIILITGKGSEQAICIKNGEKVPWDDRAIARGVINSKEK